MNQLLPGVGETREGFSEEAVSELLAAQAGALRPEGEGDSAGRRFSAAGGAGLAGNPGRVAVSIPEPR